MATESVKNQEVGQSSYTVISYAGKDLPDAYRALVFSKWLRSLRYGNEYFKLIDSEAYFTIYHQYIEQILAKPDTRVKLAVLTDDYDVVFGFSVSRDTIMDYVHVHKDSRRKGIGMSLVPNNITAFTHLTKTWMSIWNSKFPVAVFNPFA